MNDRNTEVSSSDIGRDALADVRGRAERRMVELLQHRLPTAEPPHIERLVHELGVHQIELEMQNEELLRTQAALEASRDRYRTLYDEAPVGFLTLDFRMLIHEANPVAARMLGLGSREFVVQRRFSEFIAPADLLRFQQACHTLLREHRPLYVELRLIRKGGNLIWAALRMAVTPAESSGGPQLRIAMDDVTVRIALQEDHARLAAIVSSSDDSIVGRDLEGRVTSWNRGAERMFGCPADQMVGGTMDLVIPEQRRAEDNELLARIRRGEKIEPFETERRDRDGTPIPVSLRVSPIVDDRGRVTGSSWIGRDISQRKRDERALHNRLRQLDLLSQAGQALIMGELSAPQSQQDLFDRVRLAVGGEISFNYRVDPDTGALQLVSFSGLPAGARETLESLPAGEPLSGMAVRRRAPLIVEDLQASDLDEARPMRELGVRSFAGFPLFARGEVAGVAAIASTTRDRFRQGDLQVIQTVCDQVSAMLERDRLLDELHAREQSLKLADRRKDDFIATLAHELRNPLAPIRNAVAILRSLPLPDPKLVWCRDVIDRQVVQMTRLLEDLLDVSRVTRNKIELRRERFELRRAIDAAIEATRPLIESQQHRLVLDLPDEPVAVYGDLARLTQVFANLLNNAAKYTDSGGTVRVSIRLDADYVSIAVRDDGIGMDPQQLPKVFDMFAQLTPALERSRGGLGIGLSLSRGLVEQHGGRIEARSEGPGRGSEFIVHLPIVHAALEAPRSDAPRAPRPGIVGRRVLIVDDNADAAQTLAAMLGLQGLEVRTAFSGKDGLRMAEEWQPQAAVIDIGMPHFNGYELCRRIREHPWGERMVLIACTGWGQHEDRLRARAAGFDSHLVKPVDPDDVLSQLVDGNASTHLR